MHNAGGRVGKKDREVQSKISAKREERRSERQREDLWWNVIILGTLGVVLVLVIIFLFRIQRPGPLPGEQVIQDEGRAVVSAGSALQPYLNNPPSSGTYYDKPAPWGFAEEIVGPGYYLNNLARGGVVFLYECATDCETVEQQFRDFLRRAPRDTSFNQVKIVVSRYDGDLPTPIVALAWGHQLNLEAFDEPTLLTWYDRFVNYGPANGP